MQALTDPLSTAFELISKVKAQQGNCQQLQQARNSADAAAATVPPGACPELVQQLQQLEAQVGCCRVGTSFKPQSMLAYKQPWLRSACMLCA